MTDLETLSREQLEAELSRLRQERTALVEQWKAKAQKKRDIRHFRDDPYDDRSMDLQFEAKILDDCANELAASGLPDPPEGGAIVKGGGRSERPSP